VNSNQKNLTKHQKKYLAKKQTNHTPQQEDGESPTRHGKKQQTKTTKHTIEFSNNTPAKTPASRQPCKLTECLRRRQLAAANP